MNEDTQGITSCAMVTTNQAMMTINQEPKTPEPPRVRRKPAFYTRTQRWWYHELRVILNRHGKGASFQQLEDRIARLGPQNQLKQLQLVCLVLGEKWKQAKWEALVGL